MAGFDKLKVLTAAYKEAVNSKGFRLREDNVDFFGVRTEYGSCSSPEEVRALVPTFVDNYVCGVRGVNEYLNVNYPDSGIGPTALEHALSFGYLRDAHSDAGKTKIVRKAAVDSIFQGNIVTLGPADFHRCLLFALEMLTKVENLNPRFGTFYDKLARRNGTALNYVERHVVGKLGELAASELINRHLLAQGRNLRVENSFSVDQVEAADIVQLRDGQGVIVMANRRVQIKTALGLNTVVLKEDASKLRSDTFNVDYCVFVQLLNDPFQVLLSLLYGVAGLFAGRGETDINRILPEVTLDNRLLETTAKIAGYVSVADMDYVAKGGSLPPIGEVSGDSHYAYVADLRSDFEFLAQEIAPVRAPAGGHR